MEPGQIQCLEFPVEWPPDMFVGHFKDKPIGPLYCPMWLG